MINKIRRKLVKILGRGMNIETYFNVPFKFENDESYVVNERIVEIPFVLSELKDNGKKLKILDFGCTRSWLAISLASLGHHVYGIDLRNYPFEHENLVFTKQNILDFKEKDFDIITAVSSLEHAGLGAYGEDYNPGALEEVLSKMNELIAEKGKLILTVPVGKPSVDSFLKSFAPDEIEKLVASKGFLLEKSRFFKRKNETEWLPCPREEIREVSNHQAERTKTYSGVNGVGCLVFHVDQGIDR
jgi:SAM-dependent methyltransferase